MTHDEEKAYNRGVLHGAGAVGGLALATGLLTAPKATVWIAITFGAFGGLIWAGMYIERKYTFADFEKRKRYDKVWKIVGYITAASISGFLAWSYL